ncbi:MAG: undecaprenyl-diphosphate phosphatase [bacterium]
MFEAIILALVQGLTEFLPVSSSAHLILVRKLFELNDSGLALDVATHVGSLFAVLLYFRTDLLSLIIPACSKEGAKQRLVIYKLVVATIPLVIAGWSLAGWVEANLRSTQVIAWSTLLFAIVLWWADRFGHEKPCQAEQAGWVEWMSVGASQILALIPGTSRSGASIAVGRMLGMNRLQASRLSFLLSIPAIGAAGVYEGWKLVQMPSIDWSPFAVAVIVSLFSSLLCIRIFLGLIEKIGLLPFAIYRVVLGLFLLFIQ